MRFLMFILLALVPLTSWAGECEENFSECQDNCMVEYGGSIREDIKAKFVKCVKKCGRTSTNCRERTHETKVNQLNDGALDKSPGSRDIDEDGMPILKKRPTDRASTGDDLRDDLPSSEPAAKPERVAKSKKRSKKPKEEIPEDEVIKSDRTPIASERETAPSPPPPAPPPRETPREPAPPPEPVVVKSKPPEPDREPEPAPPPPVAKKKYEEPPKPPPKKEEDHDDLRNY